ncbi:MAG: MFS transporter [Alphaproteobacteria bacterium]|nr:MFS transporter [Alphaproteobacteria bacterium]
MKRPTAPGASREPAERELTFGASLAFSAANLPAAALGIAVYVYLPAFMAGRLGVSMAVVGGAWMFVRLIDIPVDVILALLMDRTRTALGRYRVWLILSAPALMLPLWRLFMAPYGVGAVYLTVWLLALYLAMSMNVLSVSAWGATLATRYHERSRLFGLMAATGVAGSLSVTLIPTVGHSLAGLGPDQAIGVFLVALAPLSVLVAATLTPEPLGLAPPRPARRASAAQTARRLMAVIGRPDLVRLFLAQLALTLGPGWMSALYVFFFTRSWRFTEAQASFLLSLYVLAAVPGALAAAAVARVIGKHRTLMLSTTGFSLGLLSIFIVPKGNVAAAAPAVIWAGLMASSFGFMIQAMLADVGDALRLEQGQERISLVYALNGLASKLAGAFSIGLTFPLLQRLGFNPAEGAANTPQALDHLTFAFIAGPIIFVMLGGGCVIGWTLDARKQAELRAALERQSAAEPPTAEAA